MKKKVATTEVGRDVVIDDALFSRLSDRTNGFVGAEIEQIVVAALYEAFFNKRNLRVSDLDTAIDGMVPLSVTQREQILALRAWANVRAVSATPREDLETYKPREEARADAPGVGAEDDAIESQRGGRMLDF